MATTRIYLDKQRAKNNGEYPIKIVITHNRKRLMFPAEVSVLENEWTGTEISKKTANHKAKNAKLLMLRSEFENKLFDLERSGELQRLTDKELKKRLTANKLHGIGENAFFNLFETFASTREAERTRETYRWTMNAVRNFDHKANFNTVNKDWLTRFEANLREGGMAINSVSIHLRNIRAVFNYAIDEEVTSVYPFRKFKIKREETHHRDLSVDELRRIAGYEGKWVVFRDFFMLSFYLIGMNMKDIVELKKGDYRNGSIKYKRAKTKKLYEIKVEPEAKAIIEKYLSDDDYLLSFARLHKDYAGFKRVISRALKRLEDKNGVINNSLTTYYARHSWATIAASLDIPKETISAALGHSIGSTVTSIYINFDKKKVDEANRKVIDYLFGN